MKSKSLLGALAVTAVMVASGCSTPAPNYTVSIPNVQALRSTGATAVAVSEFSAQGSAANNESISVRGNPMVSPQGTFAKYLERAVTLELTEAKLLDPKAEVRVSAVLIKNDLHAAGFVTGNGELEVKFTVTRKGAVAYEKVKRAQVEWDSNFIGAIAIPRAMQNYPVLVTALLKELYADADFAKALKN